VEKPLSLLRFSPSLVTVNSGTLRYFVCRVAPLGQRLTFFSYLARWLAHRRPPSSCIHAKPDKVITIALSSLQPLISFRAVSLSTVPAIFQTMNDYMSQGVDVDVKILQPLLSLVTNFPSVHGQLLANVCTSNLLSSCPPSLVACPDGC